MTSAGLAARVVDRALAVVRRGPVAGWPDGLAEFRSETVRLVQRRWWLLTIATIAGNLAVFAIFLISLRAVGIGSSQITWIEAFAGWSLARVLQLIPLTPGGLGPVELGLTGILVGLGGPNAAVVAAVLALSRVHDPADAARRLGDDRRLALARSGHERKETRRSRGTSRRVKEQSHKDEMSAAIRGDFERLRDRGVASTLAAPAEDRAGPDVGHSGSAGAGVVADELAAEPERRGWRDSLSSADAVCSTGGVRQEEREALLREDAPRAQTRGSGASSSDRGGSPLEPASRQAASAPPPQLPARGGRLPRLARRPASVHAPAARDRAADRRARGDARGRLRATRRGRPARASSPTPGGSSPVVALRRGQRSDPAAQPLVPGRGPASDGSTSRATTRSSTAATTDSSRSTPRGRSSDSREV